MTEYITQEEYKKRNRCVNEECQSRQIEAYNHISETDEDYHIYTKCNDCGTKWIEHFKLIKYEIIEE